MEGDTIANQGPSTPMMGNQYGQPVVSAQPMAPNTVVINQQGPGVMLHPDSFKTTPVSITCPSCQKPITTTVTQQWNWLTCCLCWWTGIIFFICIQICRGKDLNCYDATHTCPQCQAVVGSYTSC